MAARAAAAHPAFSLAALAGELDDPNGNLDVLGGGDVTVDTRTVFSWSYQQLTGPGLAVGRVSGKAGISLVPGGASGARQGQHTGRDRACLAYGLGCPGRRSRTEQDVGPWLVLLRWDEMTVTENPGTTRSHGPDLQTT